MAECWVPPAGVQRGSQRESQAPGATWNFVLLRTCPGRSPGQSGSLNQMVFRNSESDFACHGPTAILFLDGGKDGGKKGEHFTRGWWVLEP